MLLSGRRNIWLEQKIHANTDAIGGHIQHCKSLSGCICTRGIMIVANGPASLKKNLIKNLKDYFCIISFVWIVVNWFFNGNLVKWNEITVWKVVSDAPSIRRATFLLWKHRISLSHMEELRCTLWVVKRKNPISFHHRKLTHNFSPARAGFIWTNLRNLSYNVGHNCVICLYWFF